MTKDAKPAGLTPLAMKTFLLIIFSCIISTICIGQTKETESKICGIIDSLMQAEAYQKVVYYATTIIANGEVCYTVYFNRGNAKSNLEDHRGAIADLKIFISQLETYRKNGDYYRSEFLFESLAHYISGWSYLALSDFENGCLSLSRAGELGEDRAYEDIKKFCK